MFNLFHRAKPQQAIKPALAKPLSVESIIAQHQEGMMLKLQSIQASERNHEAVLELSRQSMMEMDRFQPFRTLTESDIDSICI